MATIWPSTGGRPPLTAAAAEQQVRGVAEQGGDAPTVDRLISTVDDGPRHRFVWPVRDGGLCWGDYSPFGIARACFTATDLPTGPVPGLRTLGSGILDDGTWYTEFLASQEEVVRVTCNGSELLPSRAGTVDTADGSRTIYTLITPWQMRGQLPATVVRAGATTTDRLAVGGSTPLPKNDPRFRECA